MTITEELEADFEAAFKIFEKHRMYPPNHEGESMISLNDSHLMALARAKHFVQSGITGSMTPKMRDSVERDISLIEQVHSYIRQQIMEPGLPMSPEKIGQGNNGEKDGHTD